MAALFAVVMAVIFIPALHFEGGIFIYHLLIYLSLAVFFVLLYVDSDKASPLRSPAIVGIIGCSLMALYVFLNWTEISKDSFAQWHERVSCITSTFALLWLCKFFKRGSRIQYAAIAVGIILLLPLIIDVVARELLTNAFMDYANKGIDIKDAVKTHWILFNIGYYARVALAIFSAWFMFEYSSIKK